MSKTTPTYEAKMKILGKTFTSKGKTVIDAIAKLEPGNARGRAILAISNGKNTKERILMPQQTARLFNTAGITQEVARKNISLLFSGV